MTHFRFRANLAFVLAGVPSLNVFDLKRPRVGCFHKKCLKNSNYHQITIKLTNYSPENDHLQ